MNVRLANRLGATLTLPSTVSFRRVPLPMRVPNVPNAHGDGNIVVGRTRMEARQIVLSGSIYYPSRQQIRDTADVLFRFLQYPPIEVLKWSDDRRLFCWPTGIPQDWMDAGAELVLELPMIAPDPYWYGTEVTADITGPVDVAGTAPTPAAVTFEITGSGTDIELTNPINGLVIQVAGTYGAGDVVTVDTARYEATLNDEPANDRLGDEFVAKGFMLGPGANGLTYNGPAADVTVTYRPRWY